VFGDDCLIVGRNGGRFGAVAVPEEIRRDGAVTRGYASGDLAEPVVAGAGVTVEEEEGGFARVSGDVDVAVVGTV